MKKTSSLIGGSPTKITHKSMSKGAHKGAASPGAGGLVSDIGIVKKEGKRSGSSGGSGLGGTAGADNSANNSASLILEDSFEKYYNKDLDLEEDQVPVVIYELNESAINFISQEQYEKALILLQKAQTMLDQIQADKIPCDQFLFLLTLHNMAMCYQKLGILEECSICLEACIDHLESDYLQKYFNNPEQPSLRLKMLKYKCKTHMQICALLSQIHKHKDAVYHSNNAIKISHYLLNECKTQCEFYIEQMTKKRSEAANGQSNTSSDTRIINDKRFSLLEKTSIKLLPIMIEIQRKMAIEDYRSYQDGGMYITGPVKLAKAGRGNISPNRRGNVAPPGAGAKSGEDNPYYSSYQPGPGFYDCGKTDMKNILGYLNQSEWMYSLNIGNIMQISPLTLQDFMSQTSVQLELSREFILEKMCFLSVSYFCMGTEYRFLHQLKETIQEQTFERKDSEYWHGKAVEMAISFLPSESPLVSHILMSYEKHHSPSNMVIPENESQEKYIRIVRQNHGIDSCRLQPIIRHHPDADYRVPKIDQAKMNWHKIYKTEEYLKTMRLINKKQLTMGPAQANMPNGMMNRQFKDQRKAGQNYKGNNFTQRIPTQQDEESHQRGKVKSMLGMQKGSKDGKNDIESIEGDISGFMVDHIMADPDQYQIANAGINSDDEIGRGSGSDADDAEAESKRNQQAQDMFYKNSGIQSQDALNLSKSKSDDKNAKGAARESNSNFGQKQSHSQSMNQEVKNSRGQPDSQAALPPAFDKKILQQHRNSLDSDFNNKGHRKLRPAQRKGDQESGGQPSSKMLLTEQLIEGGGINPSKALERDLLQEQQSSNSLDEIEFQSQKRNDKMVAPNSSNPHRRAKSSIGVNRKPSAKRNGRDEQQVEQLPQDIAGAKTGKKTANSKRGAILSQIRDKNSSSAMAQLQPRNAESGPKIQNHIDDEDMLEDLTQNGNTYHQNHQSQPLSVLGQDNQLQMQGQKARVGQSQQQMLKGGNSAPPSGPDGGQPLAANANGQQQQKRFKANPTILNGANGDLLQDAVAGEQPADPNAQQQFMGKRNQQNQITSTAPATGGQRKKQANTINVDELQGSAQAQGNTQPQTAKEIGGGGGSKINSVGFGANHHAGTVRAGSLNNRQPQQQNQGQLGNTQLGQLGTAMGSAMGIGPSNNGFVAGTANIDQSSKNTINVYQFGSGVNFNLKLGTGNAAGQQLSNQSANMSRKQYEQIQNALNSMNSIDRPDRHSNSMDEKLFDGQHGASNPASVGLKSQIAQQQQSSISSKQYPTMQGIQNQNASSNFNQMVIPSTSSKRSQKLQGNVGSREGGSTNSSASRRKNNSQTGNKMPNFNIANQYLTQGSTNGSTQGIPNPTQPNVLHAQSDIIQIMKKRDKMNHSALAQIESGSNSRKFTASLHSGPAGQTAAANPQKIYNSKKTPSSSVPQSMHMLENGAASANGGTGTAHKTRRQLSNTDKTMNWNNQNMNATGGSQSNTVQLQPGSRKQSGSLGQRKSSLENKFNNNSFSNPQHNRQFSDISHQNLTGYKGIGQNLGGIGDSGPSGVSLTSKLQMNQQPTMSEHASMPIMNTSTGTNSRFISQGGGQGPAAVSGLIPQGTNQDMITQIPSFIQRQQQQNKGQYQGVGSASSGHGSNQQKKAQAYLVNQQHQRR